jgi:hypothetical protein
LLRATRTSLLTLREEEPPQRIGFVSDKIFEPSPVRRFFANFWLSGARLGFAGAGMLSIALIVFAARVEPTVMQQVAVDAAVTKAGAGKEDGRAACGLRAQTQSGRGRTG